MLLFLIASLTTAAPVTQWDFDQGTPGDWAPNAFLANVGVAEGVLHAEGTDWDPFLLNRAVEFPATPWQVVKIRMRASAAGRAELFWSGSLEGENGGLSQSKSVSFQVPGDNEWHALSVYPFWHREGTIRQLRFDLYDSAAFDIDWIRVEDWASDRAPIETAGTLDVSQWQTMEDGSMRLAPPLKIDTTLIPWAALTVDAVSGAAASLLWATDQSQGLQEERLELRPGKHPVNVELQGMPGWEGHLVALGLRLPKEPVATVTDVDLRESPGGPADLLPVYVGAENALNRAGKTWTMLATLQNVGGAVARNIVVRLEGVGRTPTNPGGKLRIASSPGQGECPPLSFGAMHEFRWTVETKHPGKNPFHLDAFVETRSALSFGGAVFVEPALSLPKADYVPPPQPVPTVMDVAIYYFPGWESAAKWDPIRRTAPGRKPLLGYYDEGNPEVVDWQIKWAVENGVSCFLVDWYWVGGAQHLTHWFEAYRQARYRDQLKVAIMWANHNPPNTHTREDWRAVTRHWIEHYFSLPAYYRIEGKPAIFLWDPSNLRRDLGSSEEVRAALEESRELARAAGYEGIYFATLFGHETPARAKQLADEGYDGMTNYHEWGRGEAQAENPKKFRFNDVVSTVESVWAEKEGYRGALDYFPVADTGWDARPWHGNKSLVIHGRNAENFTELLRKLRAFAEEHEKNLVVLGPANEWGEGSYVEPCTEFGFDMMEAIRRAFASVPEAQWPQNFGPADVGLGPYDLPEPPDTYAWTFDTDAGGWAAMMGIDDFGVRDGALEFTTTTADPALTIALRNVDAATVQQMVLRVSVSGVPEGKTSGQLFWTTGRGATSEAASTPFAIAANGEMQTCRIPLAAHPRWRGQITSLRLDLSNTRNAHIRIGNICLE
ncbi:MAG: glycoside hydrolase family 99-like domain-containing protein [Candidatus Hydrogenedentes bacterium]|nr:glycoside hydrolase family 99-like domain-containing protein [Candidatus Hydrogenedentota bacterium]